MKGWLYTPQPGPLSLLTTHPPSQGVLSPILLHNEVGPWENAVLPSHHVHQVCCQKEVQSLSSMDLVSTSGVYIVICHLCIHRQEGCSSLYSKGLPWLDWCVTQTQHLQDNKSDLTAKPAPCSSPVEEGTLIRAVSYLCIAFMTLSCL